MTNAPRLSSCTDASVTTMLTSSFAQRLIQTELGQISLREKGTGPVNVVCLHGISSSAASWVRVAELLPERYRLIAWDAPGYGQSDPISSVKVSAADYAQRLDAMLKALLIEKCMIVGHSLGAITASAYCSHLCSAEIEKLLLLSPAQGYGNPTLVEQREQVRKSRLADLNDLGIEATAEKSHTRLVANQKDERALAIVKWSMRRLNEVGLRQAIDLLCYSDLLALLPGCSMLNVSVGCGTDDPITPPAKCEVVAKICGVPLLDIPQAGHACYIEKPKAVLEMLQAMT